VRGFRVAVQSLGLRFRVERRDSEFRVEGLRSRFGVWNLGFGGDGLRRARAGLK
jgi:hypothetical protein